MRVEGNTEKLEAHRPSERQLYQMNSEANGSIKIENELKNFGSCLSRICSPVANRP